ncbi:MAG: hypothetical protein ACLGPL_04320, partial [Acidobacteriota bacterium]
RAESCYFLGPRGCRLRARHMICIDYLCPEVQNSLGADRLIAMQVATGPEIEATFRLYSQIKKLMGGRLG